VGLAMSTTDGNPLSTCITPRQLALLKKLDFPCSDEVLATACPVEDGAVELSGSAFAFDDLLGWVAGEANHSREGRRQDDLHEIADALEAALAGNAGARPRLAPSTAATSSRGPGA
jgi:phage terminase Nu1 subunit (DNA packaging protein)